MTCTPLILRTGTVRHLPAPDPDVLFDAARNGDRAALGRLLSLVERGGESAHAVGRLTHPRAGSAHTVGITGAPGSGKSTLTTHLIAHARREGVDIAVLAVDPSSPFSGGAILGDRVRMQDHALDPGVFIRSMATRGHLGGLALATPEAVQLLDAVGFDWVLIETVGVGQVEVDVAGSADTTVVVLNPGWGDAVQASKAGLLEVADIFVINKADRPGVEEARRDLDQMLDFSDTSDWRPPILATTAAAGEGTAELWATVLAHRDEARRSGQLERRRSARAVDELRRILTERLAQRARELCEGPAFDRLRADVIARRLDPYTAADQLLAAVL